MKEDRLSICDFCKMSESYRAQYTWNFGVYVSSSQGKRYIYNLYQVENFYVEVAYDPEKNGIATIEAFNDVSLLNTLRTFLWENCYEKKENSLLPRNHFDEFLSPADQPGVPAMENTAEVWL